MAKKLISIKTKVPTSKAEPKKESEKELEKIEDNKNEITNNNPVGKIKFREKEIFPSDILPAK